MNRRGTLPPHWRKGSVSVAAEHPGYLLSLSTQVVSAYLQRNPVSTDDLPSLITDVRHALSTADVPDAPEETPLVPAVPPKRSIQKDYIICLDCGAKLTMLKRHLRTTHDMTPEEYKARWGLPGSYPITAPNYAAQRSILAKRSGLGVKPAADRGPAQDDAGGSETASTSPSDPSSNNGTAPDSSAAPRKKNRRGPQLHRRQARKS